MVKEKKNIKVFEKDWKKLQRMRISRGIRTLAEVVEELLRRK